MSSTVSLNDGPSKLGRGQMAVPVVAGLYIAGMEQEAAAEKQRVSCI